MYANVSHIQLLQFLKKTVPDAVVAEIIHMKDIIMKVIHVIMKAIIITKKVMYAIARK